jgi:hypothetical protein
MSRLTGQAGRTSPEVMVIVSMIVPMLFLALQMDAAYRDGSPRGAVLLVGALCIPVALAVGLSLYVLFTYLNYSMWWCVAKCMRCRTDGPAPWRVAVLFRLVVDELKSLMKGDVA